MLTFPRGNRRSGYARGYFYSQLVRSRLCFYQAYSNTLVIMPCKSSHFSTIRIFEVARDQTDYLNQPLV